MIVGIVDNVALLRENVARACALCGRDPSSVTVVGVSKTFGVEAINEAVKAGITDIGENFVQEFVTKVEDIDKAANLHFIGALQTNKVKNVIGHVKTVQSVDRMSLADEISKKAKGLGISQDVLIQINAGGEASKGGVSFEEAAELVCAVAEKEGIIVKGFMTIPPFDEDISKTCVYFEKMYNLFLDIKAKTTDNKNIDMQTLSMGMSGDYTEAIKCGSTMVRVGTAIFGHRNYNK